MVMFFACWVFSVFGELSKKLAEVWKAMPEKDKLVCCTVYSKIKACHNILNFAVWWTRDTVDEYFWASFTGVAAEGAISAAQAEQGRGHHRQTQERRRDQEQRFGTIKDLSSTYIFIHCMGTFFSDLLPLISTWNCRSFSNRNWRGVTEPSAHSGHTLPRQSPRSWSHWRSSSPAAPWRVSVPDWPSTAGDRGTFNVRRLNLVELRHGLT